MPATPRNDQVAEFEGDAATVDERISYHEAGLVSYVDRLCATANKLAVSDLVDDIEGANVRAAALFLRRDFDALLQILKRHDLPVNMSEKEILVQELVLMRNVLDFACDISSQTRLTAGVQRVAKKRADKARTQKGGEVIRTRFAPGKEKRWKAIREIYEAARADLRSGGYIKGKLESTYKIQVTEKTVRADMRTMGLPTARKKPG